MPPIYARPRVNKRTAACVTDVILHRGAVVHAPRMSLVESSAAPSLLQAGTSASRPFGALRTVESADHIDGDLTRSERIGFWLYVAMGILCIAVLVAAATSAIVS
jgi:hypothetical protein